MNSQYDAQGLARLGRYGDSTLVHMQPQEVAGLQALAQSQGTSLTTNPDTGLPEAFNLGGFFSALAPVAVGALTGGAGLPLYAGIAAGAATGAALNKEDPLMGAVMGGLGGYGGVGLGQGFAAAGSGAGTAAPAAGGNMLPTASTVAQNPVGFQNAANLNAGLPIDGGISGAKAGIATQPAAPTFGQNLNSMGQGFQNVITGQEGSFDAFKQGLAGAGKPPVSTASALGSVAMPLGGAVLGGLTPNTLQMGEDPNDKYDPYATLNLGGRSSQGESGLRLLAAGGPVSFAAGGESMQGGGAGAMQGSGSTTISGVANNMAPSYGFMGQTRGPSVAPEEFGLFADQAMIDAARERQNAALVNQRSTPFQGYMGMGGMNQSYAGMGGMNQGYTGMGGIGGGLGALTRNRNDDENFIGSLNLNSQDSLRLATGGTIQTGGTQDLYGTRDDRMADPALSRDGYGLGRLNSMAAGGMAGYKKGGYLDGPGDGMSDSIPATIEGKQPARLADGEFVIPADVVSHLGNGSTKAGSKRLYNMLDKVRKARTGNEKQGKQINPSKYLPA